MMGWQVRLPAWHPQGPTTEYFADNAFGGETEALIAAKARRDVLFEGVAPPKPKRVRRTNTRNTSGAIGITLVREGAGSNYFYWVAYWSTAQGQHRKRFSVRKHGYLPAWEKALAYRTDKTGEPFSEWVLAHARLICLQRWPEVVSEGAG